MTISVSFTITSYRSRDEIQSVRKTQDPIAGLKDRLLGADLATADDIKVGQTYGGCATVGVLAGRKRELCNVQTECCDNAINWSDVVHILFQTL